MRAVSPRPQRRNDPQPPSIPQWRELDQISDSPVMAHSLDELPDDVESLKALVLVAHTETEATRTANARLAAERDRLVHREAVLAGEVDRLTARNERLDHIIAVLRRARFGRSSERSSDEQMNLALEDVETAFAAEDAAAEKKSEIVKRESVKARRANRGSPPCQAAKAAAVRGRLRYRRRNRF